MSLFSFLNPAKDFAAAVAVRLWFNQTYQRYGQMTTIQIDSNAKSIHAELDLKGETSPLLIDVKNYTLSTDAGVTVMDLGEITTSREWITRLISDCLAPENRRFKVPGAVKALL